LSRLFAGGVELRFEHVVDVAGTLGLRPAEVFRFAFPGSGEPPSAAARRVMDFLDGLSGPPPPPAPEPASSGMTEPEVERIVLKTVRRLFREGGAAGES
jgi:hypothetical protein